MHKVGWERKNVIDNDNNSAINLIIGKSMKEVSSHIFWSLCATHTLALMIKEIGWKKRIKNTVEKARALNG